MKTKNDDMHDAIKRASKGREGQEYMIWRARTEEEKRTYKEEPGTCSWAIEEYFTFGK